MTNQQIIIFAILGGMLVLFVWDRLRYDVVALLALLAAVLTGVVPPEHAFRGFSNEVLPLIAGALVVSAAIGNSGLIEASIRRLSPALKTRDLQVGVLVAIVTILSGFMKNIGALAIFLPVAVQVARKNARSPSEFLMPLSFGSLLGGLVTLIGTSPNILIAGIRAELEGAPFRMFDFTPVGLGICLCGVMFLTFGWRLLPRERRAPTQKEELFDIADYTSELAVPASSPMIGRTVAELEAKGEGELAVRAIIREEFRRYIPGPDWRLLENDVLVVESDPHLLATVVAEAKLELVGSKDLPSEEKKEVGPEEKNAGKIGVVEAVITANSPMIDASAAQLRLRERYGVNLLAVSRKGRRTTARLRRARFRSGDVVVLQGDRERLPDALVALGCLPLAERNLRLGKPRQVALPALILAAAMLAAATGLVPAAIAFIAAAVLVALLGILTLNEIYERIEWPILILLGALIPVGEAVRQTGATDLIAHAISSLAVGQPAFVMLALVLVITMLLTPILHHAAAVIVMGPVAASLATGLGVAIDPFLMAVAVGAGCDFLSPIGHQCNTLVLGAGGYRFRDYWRLGLPLSTIVVIVGVPLIMVFWPLR
ncbi:MAG: SLC13 family permease [Alphaproteobacteria bacterium]|nr:SLC13 family permease [Alphaproteobacteria bacterium]